MNMLKYLKKVFSLLKTIWIIEIKYPKLYSSCYIRFILHPDILKSTHGLFVEEGVQIKNSKIRIGNHTYIGNNTFIDSCDSIGSFCSISSDVKIGYG